MFLSGEAHGFPASAVSLLMFLVERSVFSSTFGCLHPLLIDSIKSLKDLAGMTSSAYIRFACLDFDLLGVLTCVASVSVGFQSKNSPKNGISKFWLKLQKSRSSDFFSLKPHGNACYAGYRCTSNGIFFKINFARLLVDADIPDTRLQGLHESWIFADNAQQAATSQAECTRG